MHAILAPLELFFFSNPIMAPQTKMKQLCANNNNLETQCQSKTIQHCPWNLEKEAWRQAQLPPKMTLLQHVLVSMSVHSCTLSSFGMMDIKVTNAMNLAWVQLLRPQTTQGRSKATMIFCCCHWNIERQQ